MKGRVKVLVKKKDTSWYNYGSRRDTQIVAEKEVSFILEISIFLNVFKTFPILNKSCTLNKN